MSRVTTFAVAIFLIASSALAQVANPDGERGQQFLNDQPEHNVPSIQLEPGDLTRTNEPLTLRDTPIAEHHAASSRGDIPELVFVAPCEDNPSTYCPITSVDFGTVATGAPGPYLTSRLMGSQSGTVTSTLRLVNLSETAIATNLIVHLDTPEFQLPPEMLSGGCRDLNEEYEGTSQYELLPGEWCEVIVRFAPTEPGPVGGTLTISSEEGAQPTLTLQGTGGDDSLLFGQFRDFEILPSLISVRNAHHTYWTAISAELADDFLVEGPDEWTIKVIGMEYHDSRAYQRGTLPLFDVYIVEDDEGYPGDNIVCSAPESQVMWYNDWVEGHAEIALSTPCTVSAGHYWLRAQPVMYITMLNDFLIGWGVQNSVTEPSVIHLNPPVWRNPEEGIVEGCVDWTYVYPATCVGVGSFPIYGAVFWLVGESSSSGGHTIAYDDEGDAGWRMLSSPMSGATVADLAASNLVRGLGDEYPDGDLNLYLGYTGNNDTEDPHRGFTAATARADALEPGRGFIWYLFDENFNPPESSGTSQSYAMPFNLTFSGSPVVENHEITFTEDDRSSVTDDGFYLIGNPYTVPYNVRGIVPSNGGYSMTYHHWDAAADKGGAYTLLSGLDDAEADVATGFFMQFGHLPTLPVTITFGPPVSGPPEPPNGTITRLTADFELTGELVYGENETVEVGDHNARVLFAEDATDGFDILDAGKLTPLSYYWANIALMGMQGDELVRRSIESRPLPLAAVTIPMAFSTYASGLDAGGEFTITLSDNDLGPGWQVHLTDLETGETVNMLTGSYTFTIESQPAIDTDVRFELTFTPPTVSGEGSGERYVFGLEAVWPNPTSSTTQVAFTLEATDEITIDVFDVLGRRVAQVANGEYAAGRHVLPMHTNQLASGVYVVRLTAGSQTAVQRVTVAR